MQIQPIRRDSQETRGYEHRRLFQRLRALLSGPARQIPGTPRNHMRANEGFPLSLGLVIEGEYEVTAQLVCYFREFKRRSSTELLNGCLAAGGTRRYAQFICHSYELG